MAEKRVKGRRTFSFSEDELLAFYRGETWYETLDAVVMPVVDKADIPPTATVCGVYYDHRSGSFEDDSFPVLDPGKVYPSIPVRMKQIALLRSSVRDGYRRAIEAANNISSELPMMRAIVARLHATGIADKDIELRGMLDRLWKSNAGREEVDLNSRA